MRVQRVVEDTHTLAHFFANLCLGRVQLVVCGEVHVVDVMREVVAVAVLLEVWNEIVELGLGRLERPSRRDMDASDDLVDSHETSNVAALRGLLPYVFGPVFLNALFRVSQSLRTEGMSSPYLLNRIGITETPTLPDI
jgi:hypothetical protein